jgi:cobyrinic acid a,c-diamide synthase
MAKGLVIAGTHSGCGKTTTALGLMAALTRRGLRVAPFKVGPDFIDPGHHNRVTGETSRNLDGWMLNRKYNRDLFVRSVRGADVAVVEGVMGLYDGYDGRSEAGSTAQMAKWLDLPVVLVVDARSMARSAAALLMGFERFDPDLRFAGVLFNRIGSPRHLDYLVEAMAGTVRMPVLGGVSREDAVTIPERHLGLVTDGDHPLTDPVVDRLAGLMEGSLDLDRLLDRAAGITEGEAPAVEPSRDDDPVTLAVARDNAFCFYYADNLDMLQAAGARLVEFSPVAGDPIPDGADGVYLGGGYPELFASAISRNLAFRTGLLSAGRDGMPIYAECGGFMTLCETLVDADGEAHEMAGCFPLTVRMLDRRRSLGYREVRLRRETIIGAAGDRIRGHEFHYSELTGHPPPGLETVYEVAGRRAVEPKAEGYCLRRTLGSYIHLHFGSHPRHGVARRLIQACRDYRRERKSSS